MADIVALTVVPLMAVALYSLIVCFAMLMCQRMALARALLLHAEEDLELQEMEEEQWKRERKEYISNALTVNEWVPDNLPVELAKGNQDTPTSREVAEAPQPPAPPINSSPASCAIGSDDCESLAEEEEEMASCAICLSHFEPQQLVCKSNNSLCQHVFHKDCMVDWLMKGHDTCPMCREVYLLKTV
jgi:hypothetical protein